MAAALVVAQHITQSRADAHLAVVLQLLALGDEIRALERHAQPSLTKTVGILADALHALRPEHVEYADGDGVGNAVFAQIEHQRADARVRFELRRKVERLFGGNAPEQRHALGLRFHHLERAVAEFPDQPLRR